MNKLLIIGSASVLLSLSQSAFAENSCLDSADTQAAINQCSGINLSGAKKELEKILLRIKADYKHDKVFLKKLSAAQKKWNESLSADMELKFPAENKRKYGSVYPMCAAQYKANLLASRVDYLRAWVNGAEEGEICSGSVIPRALRAEPAAVKQ